MNHLPYCIISLRFNFIFSIVDYRRAIIRCDNFLPLKRKTFCKELGSFYTIFPFAYPVAACTKRTVRWARRFSFPLNSFAWTKLQRNYCWFWYSLYFFSASRFCFVFSSILTMLRLTWIIRVNVVYRQQLH